MEISKMKKLLLILVIAFLGSCVQRPSEVENTTNSAYNNYTLVGNGVLLRYRDGSSAIVRKGDSEHTNWLNYQISKIKGQLWKIEQKEKIDITLHDHKEVDTLTNVLKSLQEQL